MSQTRWAVCPSCGGVCWTDALRCEASPCDDARGAAIPTCGRELVDYPDQAAAEAARKLGGLAAVVEMAPIPHPDHPAIIGLLRRPLQ